MLAEQVLHTAGIEAAVCASAGRAGREARRRAPARCWWPRRCSPSAALSVLARYLAAQPPWSDLPVLVMAKRGADSLEAQRAVEHLGNVTMLERPVRTHRLISAARSALRARERQYEMRAVDQRKDEFLATLAHELRNPLAPIRNAMAIVQRLHPSPQVALAGRHRRPPGEPPHAAGRRPARRGAHHQRQARRCSCRRTTTRRVVDACAGDRAGQHGRQGPPAWCWQVPDDELRAGCRPCAPGAERWPTCWSTPPSSRRPTGRSCCRCGTIAGEVAFAVRDTGVGLARSDLERIFDMFEQTRTVGEPTGGLGLGLHLTRAFAQLHGGSVRASSDGPRPGQRVRAAAARRRALRPGERRRGRAGAPCRRGPRRKVLVVDDNVDAADHAGGAAVAAWPDGQRGARRRGGGRQGARPRCPTSVVMDIGMPRDERLRGGAPHPRRRPGRGRC